ncbi:MAG: phosphotransferase [Actinomycetota bacterium]
MTIDPDITPQNQPPDGAIDAERHRDVVRSLCDRAFGPETATVGAITDVNRGRGAFSVVLRAEIHPGHDGDARPVVPGSVVAKLPVDGANGEAAIASGAYLREAVAYRHIIPRSPVRAPAVHLIDEPGDGTAAFVLEDLSPLRAVDQLDGLTVVDSTRVAETLAAFHRSWRSEPNLGGLAVRRNTIAGFAPDVLQTGLRALADRWADAVDPAMQRTFGRLVSGRDRLVERFDAASPTLCHGDPRADNLVFDQEGAVVLFDWQQLAVQPGEADLAWLAATSLRPEVRRRADDDLIAAADSDRDRYRLGFALPGLAVLLLAQRQFPTERGRRFVAASLQRIGTALDDLGVADLAR